MKTVRSDVLPLIADRYESWLGPRENWSAHQAAHFDAVVRVVKAALKGGAKAWEVEYVGCMAVSYPLLGQQINRDNPLVRQRRKALKAIQRINADRVVTPDERAKVERLNRELFPAFPKANPRYREISERLSTPKVDFKVSRVRYIVEGPRKSKRKQ